LKRETSSRFSKNVLTPDLKALIVGGAPMWLCKSCGHDNPDDALVCENCGALMDEIGDSGDSQDSEDLFFDDEGI